MLSIGVIKSIEYYTNLAGTDSYYQSGLEPSGQWGAQGAAELGLHGIVTGDALRALLAGQAPDGRGQVQNAGKVRRQQGWDLTFSADKSVSVLWSQADAAVRQEIEEAHADAVKAACGYLEDVAAWTRRGRGGQLWEKASIVMAAFEHGSSRAGDCQLHTHALIPNMCVRSDRTLGSLASKPIYLHKMTAGSLYRAELAAQLEERLGLQIERDGPLFHLPGVPIALIKAFSKRRAQIEQEIKARGIVSAAGAAAVTLATRTAKQQLSREELRAQWQETGRQYGFTEQQVHVLIGQAQPQTADIHALLTAGVTRLMEGQSWFNERSLLRTVAEMAPGTGLSVRDLRAGLQTYLATDPEMVSIGEDRLTTREMLRIEQELLQTAERLHQEKTSGLDPALVARAMHSVEAAASKQQGKPILLNPEQKSALEHVTQMSGNIQLVSGMAGTGKTFFLSAARAAWETGGYKVIGAALAGKAAQGLQEGAGITSSTLTRLLMDLNYSPWQTAGHHVWQLTRAIQGKQTWSPPSRITMDRHTVLVIDEAGMVGTRMFSAVVKAVEKAGAKLVLVGDAAQLQAIDSGGVFASLQKRLGGAKLTHIVRQRHEWARQAVMQFAAGETQAALQEYAKRGLLYVAESRPDAAARLITDWKTHGVTRPQNCLIFTGSRQERDLLNRQAQEARRVAGAVGWLPLAINGTRFYLGDRVMFTQNARMYGVQNGLLGTLLSVDPIHNIARIRLDGEAGKAGKCVSIPLNKYRALELGYAVTTHKGQGVTVERAYVLAGGSMQDRELTYVQMSRAKEETRLYADASSTGAELSDLVRDMARSRQKTMALNVVPVQDSLRQTHREAKPPRPSVQKTEHALPNTAQVLEMPALREATTLRVEVENVALTPMPASTPPIPTPSKPIVPTIRPK